jgi:hypothetical protein
MRPLLRFLTVAVAAIAPTACNALVGDYEADLVPDAAISSEHLCDIERDNFTFELDLQSNAQQPDLTAYYDAANPKLNDHLSTMAQSYRNGNPGKGVTYIMGAAGVGKSFAARNIIGGFDDTEKCSVKLSELFYDEKEKIKLDFSVAQAPDLTTIGGQTVFNELPTIEEASTFELDGLFTAAGCKVDGTLLPVIVIDDLDEVHDATCKTILKEVDEFILSGAPGAGHFVHIIVLGRPEGFYTWLGDPEWNEQNQAIVESIVLNPPRYQTAGDLEFRVRGYLDFKDLLSDLEASGEVNNYIESVTTAVAAYPFLTYSLGNLSVGNEVVAHTIPGLDVDEELLKAEIFDDMVVRAGDTHGRPKPGSTLGGAYLRLLEDIAVRYADVSDDGQFSVRSEDTVEVWDDDGNSLGKVRVRDVLNRAGVALRSLTNATARYQFDPFWVHGHLIERYNLRSDPSYTYRTCE